MIQKVKIIDDMLAVKLGDPVENNGAGEVYTQLMRLQYINIAYNKLRRILSMIVRGQKPEFVSQRAIYEINHDAEKNDMRGVSLFDIPFIIGLPDDVFVNYQVGSKILSKEVSYIKPAQYLRYRNGINTTKEPSFEDETFYYTILNGKLTMLPKASGSSFYTKIEILHIPDQSFYNLEDSLFITNDYIDMLIDLAAIQGMQDAARADKVQLYRAELYDQLKLIGEYSQLRKIEEGILTVD